MHAAFIAYLEIQKHIIQHSSNSDKIYLNPVGFACISISNTVKCAHDVLFADIVHVACACI